MPENRTTPNFTIPRMNSPKDDSVIISEPNTIARSEQDREVKEPTFYHVILLNDDYTPMDFVIKLLMALFGKNYQEAYDITMQVHHFQKGVAGIYPYEIAIEKMQQANDLAAMNEFPLHCVIEQQ